MTVRRPLGGLYHALVYCKRYICSTGQAGCGGSVSKVAKWSFATLYMYPIDRVLGCLNCLDTLYCCSLKIPFLRMRCGVHVLIIAVASETVLVCYLLLYISPDKGTNRRTWMDIPFDETVENGQRATTINFTSFSMSQPKYLSLQAHIRSLQKQNKIRRTQQNSSRPG